MTTDSSRVYLWSLVFVTALAWSAYRPTDYFTWALEVSPAVIGAIILAASYHSFRLTGLLYLLILLHCLVLIIGGHYTYAEVPLFDELGIVFGSGRNNYDKLGHFMQGFVPAIITREILLRKAVVRRGAWLILFILSVCLAFSALYELIEWFVAVMTGTSAEAFLGTQGYIWDTQSDMAMCLLGAVAALLTLSRVHDLQLAAMNAIPPPLQTPRE
jgi:putative membrane protein